MACLFREISVTARSESARKIKQAIGEAKDAKVKKRTILIYPNPKLARKKERTQNSKNVKKNLRGDAADHAKSSLKAKYNFTYHQGQ